jgi:two-component system cell cycle response regulator DivK
MDKKTILVVEDNMDNYELVRVILEHGGYDVFLAVNGRDSVDAARLQQPDLILMDLSLPEMDGWNAAERIKADPSTKDIPIYALTAHTLPRDRFRAMQAGCDGYFTKPLNVEGFLTEVSHVLEKKKKSKRRPRKLIF